MSSKTIIQGMPQFPEANGNGASDIYAPNQGARAGRTVVYDAYQPQKQTAARSYAQPVEHPITIQARAIAGVMFTISRTPAGEIFPLYLGRNTIGADPGCDVCLRETSVLPDHASLLIRRIAMPDGSVDFSASLRDAGNLGAVLVNGNPVDTYNVPCHNGDILTIGNHYRLLLTLYDTVEHGLTVDDNFQAFPELPKAKPAEPAPAARPPKTFHKPEGATMPIDIDIDSIELPQVPQVPRAPQPSYTSQLTEQQIADIYGRPGSNSNDSNLTVISGPNGL